MLLGAATVAPLVRRLCPGAVDPVPRAVFDAQLRRSEEADPTAAAERRRRLLGRGGLCDRRTDPSPSRRGGGCDGVAEPAHPQRAGRALPVRRGRLPGRDRRHRHGPQHGRRPCRVRRPAQVRRTPHARACYAQEIGQIAGRAGRFRKDGAFGVTGEAPDLDPDIVAAVEGHAVPGGAGGGMAQRPARFPVAAGPDALAGRAAADGGTAALRGKPGRDDAALSSPATRPSSGVRGTAPISCACGRPARRRIFARRRRTSTRGLIGGLFEHLTQGDRRIPEDWMQGQFSALDRTRRRHRRAIDAARPRPDARLYRQPRRLAGRPVSLAGPRAGPRGPAVRHAASIADAAIRRPAHEHALAVAATGTPGPILGGIGADGAVTVEGHIVGRLIRRLHFEPERGDSALENRALRGAVERAVAPEIARRLGELAAEGRRGIRARPGGVVAWRGLAAGQICGGGPVQAARPAHRRIRRRRRARAGSAAARGFRGRQASRRLFVLKRLDGGDCGRAAQGAGARASPISWSSNSEFWTAGGRTNISARSAANERRVLKSLGVRFGAFSLLSSGFAYARSAGDRRGVRRTRRAALAPGRREASAVLPHPPRRPRP